MGNEYKLCTKMWQDFSMFLLYAPVFRIFISSSGTLLQLFKVWAKKEPNLHIFKEPVLHISLYLKNGRLYRPHFGLIDSYQSKKYYARINYKINQV